MGTTIASNVFDYVVAMKKKCTYQKEHTGEESVLIKVANDAADIIVLKTQYLSGTKTVAVNLSSSFRSQETIYLNVEVNDSERSVENITTVVKNTIKNLI